VGKTFSNPGGGRTCCRVGKDGAAEAARGAGTAEPRARTSSQQDCPGEKAWKNWCRDKGADVELSRECLSVTGNLEGRARRLLQDCRSNRRANWQRFRDANSCRGRLEPRGGA
jgi:hypothetical protein